VFGTGEAEEGGRTTHGRMCDREAELQIYENATHRQEWSRRQAPPRTKIQKRTTHAYLLDVSHRSHFT